MDKGNLATVENMWRREVEAATTYAHLADRESDPKRKDILLRLAAQEENHAARWAERIAAATGRTPDRKAVEKGLSWFQRISDQSVVLHRLEQEENKAEAEYEQLMARLSDPSDRRIAEEAMLEERDHAVVLRTLAGGAMPSSRKSRSSFCGRWSTRNLVCRRKASPIPCDPRSPPRPQRPMASGWHSQTSDERHRRRTNPKNESDAKALVISVLSDSLVGTSLATSVAVIFARRGGTT
jgi:rubrerythrin